MGQMELSGGRKCYVFASETCAFDLIGAVYLHDVEPGEMVIVGPEGMTRERYAPEQRDAPSASSSTSISRGPIPWCSAARCRSRARMLGRLLARECPADADLVVPVPDSGVAAAIGYSAESRHPVPPGADPQPLRGPHVHRALAGHSRFRRQAEAQPGAAPARRQARGAGGRFHRARHHQPQDRPHGAQAGAREVHVRISCPPTDFAVLLRRGYAHQAAN